ncbi:hypothetical protein TEHN7128_1929 [Tetragenococcus halophilus subsp. halophilus]|uniref:Uncharacterized protein n=1 Tax=Tetragenococcus halophilus subsp. halophilus TaxID=1513897 RepID=A0A2H6DBZ1_TETHA|nr:hypothetical protein TEHD23766T_1441 [Tetragenococcus halophilus subsp. flandriensis]GBD66993.1 hypothetical protein TEHN7116_1957 [Tetragenococcus halophilus subsp. halophilus]GBD69329.1 hypothetical protein TEHN7118_2135 [Tetragenococcus halophilus subsp. halophilus]GBD72173.1 hypothetical protein TEHN7125_0333 [Tetragenococcus halophilus subsp. halophilus]GBD74756.1 hypothetical protein TEHN7126_0455 [Tetragenococcus halophilus subsp. halophilus]
MKRGDESMSQVKKEETVSRNGEVGPQYEFGYQKHICCCVANSKCYGEYKVFLNGNKAFNRRCC